MERLGENMNKYRVIMELVQTHAFQVDANSPDEARGIAIQQLSESVSIKDTMNIDTEFMGAATHHG